MKKTQEIILLITLAMIIIAFLFPPSDRVTFLNNNEYIVRGSFKWRFIISNEALRKHYDILGVEIFGILILSSIAFIVAAKKKD